MHRRAAVALTICLVAGLSGGCGTFGKFDQEIMGQGIVRGTLGSQAEWQVRLFSVGAPSLSGQVIEIEGGAYIIQPGEGLERQIPHDENTRIDRPAHVGDRIEAWLDDRGRAVVIRNIDHD